MVYLHQYLPTLLNYPSHKYLLSWIIVFFNFTVLAQSTFVKTYDGEGNQRGNYIQTLPDGGFIVSGYSTVSGNQDALLVRLNSDGEVLWSKTYGGAGYDEFFCAKVMPDGSFVALGSSDSFDDLSTSKNVYIVKVNSVGELIWNKVLSKQKVRGSTSGISHEMGYDLTVENNGDVFWNGRTMSDQSHMNRIFGKIDTHGNQLFYVMDESNANAGAMYGSYAMCNLKVSQGWMLGGAAYDQFGIGGFDVNLTLLDESGSQIWSKSYGQSGSDNNYKIMPLKDGYVFSAAAIIGGVHHPRIYEVDLLGVPRRIQQIVPTKSETMSAYDFRHIGNENIITMRSWDAVGGGAYLVKADATDVIWAREYGTGPYNAITKMDTTEYGGFVMVGFTFNSSSGTEDLMIVKADSLGNAGCNTQDAEFTVQTIPNTYRDRTTYYSTGSAEAFIQSEETEVALESQSDVVNFSLGNDTVVCPGASVVIGTDVEADSYYWMPGGETTATIQVSDSGSYQLVIEKDGCTLSDEIKVNWRESQIVDLGTDIVLCFGDSLLIVSPIIGDSYYWEPNGETSSSVYVKDSTIYRLTVTRSGCEYQGELNVSNQPSLAFDLGEEVVRCKGDTLRLESPRVAEQYMWYPNGESNSEISVSESGWYRLIITEGECSATDSTHVSFQDSLDINLGDKAYLCEGDSVELSLDAIDDGFSYEWWPNGDTSSSIWVLQPGKYSVRVEKNGCTGEDTLEVMPIEELSLSLGADTTICLGDSLRLQGVVGQENVWYPQEQERDFIYVHQAGEYVLEVAVGECISSDTILLDVLEMEPFSLGNDTIICHNQELSLGVEDKYEGYSWFPDGQETPLISVGKAGSYILTTYEMGCAFSDTLVLQIDSLSPLHLGEDTNFCGVVTLILDASVVGGGDYQWSTGTTQAVDTIVTGGEYWVNLSRNGCSASDTISVFEREQPLLYLDSVTFVCQGDSARLYALVEYSDMSEIDVSWSTGEVERDILVADSGWYWFRAASPYCLATDSTRLSFHESPDIDTLYFLCREIVPYVEVDVSCDICEGVFWSDSLVSFQRNVEYPSVLELQVFDNWGCSSSHRLHIVEDVSGECAPSIYVPNAFTPNGDGKNDRFFPVFVEGSIDEYHLEIFNRWGGLIFETFDAYSFWDGLIKGKQAPIGIYNWKITYLQKYNVERKLERGKVTLVR